jgi:hypothetical protein
MYGARKSGQRKQIRALTDTNFEPGLDLRSGFIYSYKLWVLEHSFHL